MRPHNKTAGQDFYLQLLGLEFLLDAAFEPYTFNLDMQDNVVNISRPMQVGAVFQISFDLAAYFPLAYN